MSRPMSLLVLVPVSLALTVACKKTEEEIKAEATAAAMAKVEANTKTTRQICDARLEWKHASARKCTTCLSMAAAPDCETCNALGEYAGKCLDVAELRMSEPQCEGVVKCVTACKKADCNCKEKCYEGKPACQKIVAAVNACTTDVCAQYCN